jgi:cobalt transporter subunit CbtA
MFLRILLTALIAGLIGGVAVSGLQALGTTPLILKAETYETGGKGAEATVQQDHGEEWAPHDGWERVSFTLLANVLMAVGFAALLASAFTVLANQVGLAGSVGWGLAGFAAFGFIPSIGLPPELPGMIAADIASRQFWWWSSAIASCIGLGLLAFAPRAGVKALGAVAIALPFVVGAPHAVSGAGSVPPELAAQFVTVSLGTGLVFWLILAASAAWSFRRLEAFCLAANHQREREEASR